MAPSIFPLEKFPLDDDATKTSIRCPGGCFGINANLYESYKLAFIEGFLCHNGKGEKNY